MLLGSGGGGGRYELGGEEKRSERERDVRQNLHFVVVPFFFLPDSYTYPYLTLRLFFWERLWAAR